MYEGLPIWLVELRHQATHEKIPPLGYLRKAHAESIQWLHDNYWVVQANALQDMKDLIAGHLQDYRTEFLKEKSSPHYLQKHLQSIIDSLSGDTFVEVLFPVLLHRGFMIPDKKPKKIPSRLDEKDSNVQVWIGILEECHAKWSDFIFSLIEKLFELGTESNADPYFYLWIHFLLDRFGSGMEEREIISFLKLCFAKWEGNSTVLNLIKIVKTFPNMPSPSHRYHTAIDYLLKIEQLDG